MPYVGKTPVVGNFVKLDAIVTSATATYNLLNGGVAYFPQTANNCIVSLNGVIQSPTSAYTISGSTIVFSDALTSSDSIDFILVLGDVLAIGTPSDGTVGFAKVTSNLITGATAETSIADADTLLIYDDSATALRKMTKANFVSGIGGANTPSFSVYRATTTQTFTQNTNTKTQFNTEVYDTDSAFDSTTNYRFTVPSGKAGKYFFHAQVADGTVTSNTWEIHFFKNGSDVQYYRNVTGTNYGTVSISTVLDLAVSDYVEVFMYSGAASPICDYGIKITYFQGFKLL
jgi:hypothetical protein